MDRRCQAFSGKWRSVVARSARGAIWALVVAVLLASATPVSGVLLRGLVTDSDSQGPLPARVVAAWPGGSALAFAGGDGHFEVALPDDVRGQVTLSAYHGLEFAPATRQLDAARLPQQVAIALDRIADMKALGWFAGDTHCHSTCSDGRQSPSDVAKAAIAEGLDWAALTDHNTIDGAAEWLAASSDVFLPIVGQEVSTELGHIVAFHINRLVEPNASDPAEVARIFDDIHAQGGLASIAHPSSPNIPYKAWEATGFDAIEAVNGGVPPLGKIASLVQGKGRWLRMLADGRRIAAVSGSDCHDIASSTLSAHSERTGAVVPVIPDDLELMLTLERDAVVAWAQKGHYLGIPRTYVRLPDRSPTARVEALRRGEVFVTNSILLLADIGGIGPGGTVRLPGHEPATVNIWARSAGLIRRVRILANGDPVWEKGYEGVFHVTERVSVAVETPGWVMVESYGDLPDFAFTNAIYLEAAA